MKIRFLSLACLAFGLSAGLLSAAPVLVGHPGLSAHTLSPAEAESVLLGRQVTIGSTRAVIVLAKTNEAEEPYLRDRAARTSVQFRNHWRRLFMTGGGSAPVEVDTVEDLVKAIANTPGAVGIVDETHAEGLTILAR